MYTRQLKAIQGLLAIAMICSMVSHTLAQDSITLNQKDDGYRGIWYFNQKSDDEYVYKYSGGLGTYCAKHKPFAIHAPQVEKTFFCYGGTTKDSNRELLHLVSYFDHRTGRVPRPTILLDKQTSDAHDNPVISIDDQGYIWIFSTSHGRSRPSYVHRSQEPYDIECFEQVAVTYEQDGESQPLDNFSYMQAWHVPPQGFVSFFTRYGDPAQRTNMFMTSQDGVRWSAWQRLAAIDMGHYQISAVGGGKAACVFNYHQDGKGLNWRTNLYYMETEDFGKSWQAADGGPLDIPLTEVQNDALIHDYEAEELLVYLKDIRLDDQGRPVILFLTSQGYQSGPDNDPRTWTIAALEQGQWKLHPITTSDNNYDMGSLFIEEDDTWRVIGPTEPGPQAFNPGGEVGMWVSHDRGEEWNMTAELTAGSPYNHTYVRRVQNPHPDFYALWADGHGRQPSESRLYFCNRQGDVFQLPSQIENDTATPTLISGKQ